MSRTEIAVVLPDIRSAHNVGSLFRTADAAGASRVFLAGHTPRPVDRFGRPEGAIAKTALGAELTVPWEYARYPRSLVSRLRREGWYIVGVEQDARSVDYRTVPSKPRTAFVFGNEVDGLHPRVRALCDVIAEIPMHGSKESLNVSVAAGVVLFSYVAAPADISTRARRRRDPRRRGGV